MQQKGYDSMVDDIDKVLEETEYEIIHNAEKQQQVIESMLNNVVGMYQDAYGKINSIIANTGFIGSSDFNNKQEQLGTQQGASNQVNDATKNPWDTNSSSTANDVVTDKINDNSSFNSQLESELSKEENITNRKVAELTVSKSSVSIEEGKSIGVTASVRPNDAANKTLSWSSSNTGVATVSNGTIKGVKPGSCTITVATTDGSGLSRNIAVTVTAKPVPTPAPKPTTTTKPPTTSSSSSSSSGSGDGKAKVGDKVTFKSGRYYETSAGSGKSGNKNLGKSVYITRIVSGKKKPYHISTGKKLGSGDLGWVTLSQLKGYRVGSKSIPNDQLAFTHDNEFIIRPDGGVLRQVGENTTITPPKFGDNIFKWGNTDPDKFLAQSLKVNAGTHVAPRENTIKIENSYDTLLNIENVGNLDKQALPELQEIVERACEYTTQRIFKEATKAGARRRF